MKLSTQRVFQVAPVVQTGQDIAQRHLAQCVAQFEIRQCRADPVGHRAQALFGIPRRAHAAQADIDRDVQQAQDLPLSLDGHADVTADIFVRMAAPDGALSWHEMRITQPQRPAFVRRQGCVRLALAAPCSDMLEHVTRFPVDEKRSHRFRKQLHSRFTHDRVRLGARRT